MSLDESGQSRAGQPAGDEHTRHGATSSPVIAIHAGAGALPLELREGAEEVRTVLGDVLAGARARLERGEQAVAVAVAAVAEMEAFPLFNAGVGAALCDDGSVELSASIMRGSDQAAGAVAGVGRVRSPIVAAHAVLRGRQVLLIGASAERFATAEGLEICEPETFITERQRQRLASRMTDDGGTVGAVCLDAHGVLAAATSTGGVMGQPPGRVGDSPLIGAGTWADPRVAVSCTGDGEDFIRAGVARAIAAAIETGATLDVACARALAAVGELGGSGGLIALTTAGAVALPHSTAAMPRGVWRAGAEPEVWVAEPASARA